MRFKMKRLWGILLSLVLVLGMMPGLSMTARADEGSDTGKWVINSDGTLSIDKTAAANAVSTNSNGVTLVLIGSNGGTITLPANLGSDVVTKISSDKDAVLVLYKSKVANNIVSEMLQNVKFSPDTTSINIAVTDGKTTIDVSSDDTTFGILGVNGEAHIYKYVGTSLTSWIDAFDKAVKGDDLLGGFKGYLATITTDNEAKLLYEFYKSVQTSSTQGGWIAATSMRYSTNKNASSYSDVQNSLVTPENYDNTNLDFNKTIISGGYKITGSNGAYYWTYITNSSTYKDAFYWACGPEKGQKVNSGLWNNGEPNNMNGESCVVASYSGSEKFNDFPPNQEVPGYFLEFSVYSDGLASDDVAYKSTTIYKVSYDGNGATGGSAPGTQEKIKGTDLTLAGSGDLVRTGYTFKGWNTQADGKGTECTAGGTYTADASVTLYAQWELTPPTIAGPSNLELTYGYTEGSVSVTATAAEGNTLSYQWYSNTTNSNSDGTVVDGATTASYIIPTGKSAGTTEYYYCVVTATRTDTEQTATATSSVATVTINKKGLTIKADAKNKVYGNDDPELTYTSDGLVEGDSITGALSRAEGKNAGTYEIRQGTLTAGDNYEISYTPALLTINKAASDTSAPMANELTYEGTAQALVTAGTPTGGTLYYSTDGETYSTAIPTGTNAGQYTVYYKVIGDANHSDKDAQKITVTILAKALTIKAVAKSKTYGEDDPALTYTSEGLVEGDSITGALSRAEGEDVGTYAITQDTLTAGNNVVA